MTGIRETAEADLACILEDGVLGAGWPVTVTNPSEVSESFTGYSNDISQVIDPDTGQAVSGRAASVVLRISTLTAAGFSLPVGISDTAAKPWIVQFDDIGGSQHTFKIIRTDPDRTLGIVSCLLQVHK